MKLIPLSGSRAAGRSAIVDDADFDFLSKFRWSMNNDCYAIHGHRNVQFMHRVINKTPDGMETDHINRNPLDNRRENLRTCSHRENMMNKRRYRNNKSGVPGVHFNKQCRRWQAYIRLDGRLRHLGLFDTLEAAAAARGTAAKELFGSFLLQPN